MKPYPLFRKENIPAYLVILVVWFFISISSAGLLSLVVEQLPLAIAFAWAAITVMLGMSIMFVASMINLRKLTPGFKRLAAGDKDPGIPPVWCPVLTAATNAAIELATAKLSVTNENK